MTTIIKPKRSEVAASDPTTSDLSTGEIAINSTDGKMYIKDSGNVIREIGGAGAVSLQTATNVSNKTTNDIELNGDIRKFTTKTVIKSLKNKFYE